MLVPLQVSVVQTLLSGGQNVPEGAADLVPSSQNPAPEWPDPGAGPQRSPMVHGFPSSQACVPLVPHWVQFVEQYHPTAHCWLRAQAVAVNLAVHVPAPVPSFKLQYCSGELHLPSLPRGFVLVALETLQPAQVPALQNPEAQSPAIRHAEPLATRAACTTAIVPVTRCIGSSCWLHAEGTSAKSESRMGRQGAQKQVGFAAVSPFGWPRR